MKGRGRWVATETAPGHGRSRSPRPSRLSNACASRRRAVRARASKALAAVVRVPIARIAIRVCPELPPTTEERIVDNRAQAVADSVMYREALAAAAEARGWSVYWYDRERVFRDAATVLGGDDIDALLSAMGRSIGPPWRAGHKLAQRRRLRPKRSRPRDERRRWVGEVALPAGRRGRVSGSRTRAWSLPWTLGPVATGQRLAAGRPPRTRATRSAGHPLPAVRDRPPSS